MGENICAWQDLDEVYTKRNGTTESVIQIWNFAEKNITEKLDILK